MVRTGSLSVRTKDVEATLLDFAYAWENIQLCGPEIPADHDSGTSGRGSIRPRLAAFLEHQEAKGITKTQVENTRSRLNRIAADCRFKLLSDLNATALERWLVARQGENMGAVTRNGYREAWITFGNWCVRNQRLLSNPFAAVAKADAKSDPRRKRRSMDEGELIRLLDVARRRPLQDAMTVRRGRRKGEAVAELSDERAAGWNGSAGNGR